MYYVDDETNQRWEIQRVEPNVFVAKRKGAAVPLSVRHPSLRLGEVAVSFGHPMAWRALVESQVIFPEPIRSIQMGSNRLDVYAMRPHINPYHKANRAKTPLPTLWDANDTPPPMSPSAMKALDQVDQDIDRELMKNPGARMNARRNTAPRFEDIAWASHANFPEARQGILELPNGITVSVVGGDRRGQLAGDGRETFEVAAWNEDGDMLQLAEWDSVLPHQTIPEINFLIRRLSGSVAKTNPSYMIPLDFPIENYTYSPPPIIANWTAHPTWCYDTFLRNNPSPLRAAGRKSGLKPVPDNIPRTPRSAAEHISAIGERGRWPIGDLFHARLALVYILSPSHDAVKNKVIRAVKENYPEYDWDGWLREKTEALEAKRGSKRGRQAANNPSIGGRVHTIGSALQRPSYRAVPSSRILPGPGPVSFVKQTPPLRQYSQQTFAPSRSAVVLPPPPVSVAVPAYTPAPAPVPAPASTPAPAPVVEVPVAAVAAAVAAPVKGPPVVTEYKITQSAGKSYGTEMPTNAGPFLPQMYPYGMGGRPKALNNPGGYLRALDSYQPRSDDRVRALNNSGFLVGGVPADLDFEPHGKKAWIVTVNYHNGDAPDRYLVEAKSREEARRKFLADRFR